MKKVLVTGATGFIGNYVVLELLKNNYEVIATSSNKAKAEVATWYSSVRYIPFDLKEFDNKTNYLEYFENPDSVIHLAWEGLPNYKDSFHLEENLPRHYSFLKNFIEHGLAELTVTGTCFEYGMQEGCLQEDLLPMPANSYAIAKDNLRKSLSKLQTAYSFSFKWVRLFYMYGKGQNQKSLFSQLDAAIARGDTEFKMSGGEQVRDYLPVETVAEQIVGISSQRKVDGIINCCSGKPVTIKELVAEYLIKNNKTISLTLGYYPYPDYEPMKFWGDNSKLKSIFKK